MPKLAERLDSVLYGKLVHAGQKVKRSMTERDELIVEAVSRGASLRAVGEAAGVSYETVRSIVNRYERGTDASWRFDVK